MNAKLKPFLSIVLLVVIGIGAGCSVNAPSSGGDTTPDPPADPDASTVAAARELEEADIVKQDGNHLYLANPYLGLRIIDVSAIERPVLVGSVDASGRAVELYVYNDHVYMICTADFYSCAGVPVDFDSSEESPLDPGYEGSRLYVFDTSDPTDPALETIIPVAGTVTSTRRVDHYLYLAGNAFSGAFDPEEASTNGSEADTNGVNEDETAFALSYDLTAAGGIEEKDQEAWHGIADEIHTTEESMYVIGDDPDMDDTSLVTFLDISSPSGLISMRDRFRVPGVIRNRFFVDAYENVFRVITAEKVEAEDGYQRDRTVLYTYDVSNPEIVERISRLTIETDEDVWGVRFDGERGYVTTYYSSGPLWVLDLSDPADPQVAGTNSKPGISTHMVPLGDQLLAVGFDPTRWYRPVISIYDVSIISRPRLLDRVTIEYPVDLTTDTASEALFDEKALAVLESEGLILFPFSYRDDNLDWIDAIELISFTDTGDLQELDTITHRGLVRRSGVLDTRLWILSDVAFQVVDMDTPTRLESLFNLDILTDQELLDAGLSDCVDSARYHANPMTQWYEYLQDYPLDWGYGCAPMPVPTLAMLLGSLLMLRFAYNRKR